MNVTHRKLLTLDHEGKQDKNARETRQLDQKWIILEKLFGRF